MSFKARWAIATGVAAFLWIIFFFGVLIPNEPSTPSPTFPDTTMARVLQERDSLQRRTEELTGAVRQLQLAAALYAQEAIWAEGQLDQLKAECADRVVLQ